jgi:hypothetical protein
MTSGPHTTRFYELTEEDRKRLAEIIAKIKSLTKKIQQREAWFQQLKNLEYQTVASNKRPDKEGRIPVYQAVREAGVIPEEAAFFLIAYTLEWIAEDRVMAEFQRRMDLASQATSLSEQKTLMDENDGYERRILLETFREFGEHDMADMYENQRAQFEKIKIAGRRFFFDD